MPRPQGDDLREADGRFVRPLLTVEEHAEVVVRVRVLGIYAYCDPIVRFGFFRLAFGPQDHTEIVVRVGVLRFERDRALVCDDRIVELESILQDDPQIAVPVRSLRFELQAPPDQRDCILASCLLMREDAREVQRARMVGRDIKNAAVDVCGSSPLLALLQREGDRHRLVQAEGAVVPGHRSRPRLCAASPNYPSLLPLRSYLK